MTASRVDSMNDLTQEEIKTIAKIIHKLELTEQEEIMGWEIEICPKCGEAYKVLPEYKLDNNYCQFCKA